jgi:anti-sigma B factor antagonist
MKMRFETCGSFGLLRLDESRLDASVAIQFKDRFRDLTQAEIGDVILDLEQVEFLDSSGLGALVAARKLLGADRRLELVGLTPPVARVMTLTRMDIIFPIHADLAAARAAHLGAA